MLRRACVPVAVALAATLGAPSPAQADAKVSPATAEQGAGVNLTFSVTNDSPTAAITKVRLVMPAAIPVAEVYPLSVDDWAPLLKSRPVNPPLPSIHGGAPVTETTGEIIWSAVRGKELRPGASSNLMVAIGPMPEADQIQFTLEPTYAGGAKGPALPAVAVALAPPAAAPAEDVPAAEPAPLVDNPDFSSFAVGGWIVALLTGAIGVLMWLRSRRAAAPASPDAPAPAGSVASADAPADGTTDGAAADDADASRPRVTAWSYRDRP